MELQKNKEEMVLDNPKDVSAQTIFANSEIGRLKRILVHSPDGGIGKVVPGKAQDWLYEDIVELDQMRAEYDLYIQILLYFLDPDKIKQLKAIKAAAVEAGKTGRLDFFKPDKEGYFASDKVIEVQYLLSELLKDELIKHKVVASICSIEQTSFEEEQLLLSLSPRVLAKTLITGYLVEQKRFIFAPVPNLIFTRDISVVINDHLLLTRFSKDARYRESIIMKNIAYYLLFKEDREKVIELTEEEDFFLAEEAEKIRNCSTVEGGDVMMIAPRHLLVGCSERSTVGAINKMIHYLFKKEVVDLITVIKIPPKRYVMHIDTVFTMVKRNCWVLFGPLSRKGQGQAERNKLKDYVGSVLNDKKEGIEDEVKIIQYDRSRPNYGYRAIYQPPYLEDLFEQICRHDFQCNDEMQFIYSGGGEFPENEREQWTDSCNVLALKEGVVIGYDRNKKTSEAFKKHGFKVVHAVDLLAAFDKGDIKPEEVENTLILLPSAELSRARGGSHCMSMPLERSKIEI